MGFIKPCVYRHDPMMSLFLPLESEFYSSAPHVPTSLHVRSGRTRPLPGSVWGFNTKDTFPPFVPTRMARVRSAFSLPYPAGDVHRCNLGFLGEKRFNNRYNLFNKCQTIRMKYPLSTFTSRVLEGVGSLNLRHPLSSHSCFFSPNIIYLRFLSSPFNRFC